MRDAETLAVLFVAREWLRQQGRTLPYADAALLGVSNIGNSLWHGLMRPPRDAEGLVRMIVARGITAKPAGVPMRTFARHLELAARNAVIVAIAKDGEDAPPTIV